MIITQKVTYLAFSVHDGKRNLTYLHDLGFLSLNQNIRKFRLKVKWNSYFQLNPFGNCTIPPEVVLFSRSDRRNGGIVLIIC